MTVSPKTYRHLRHRAYSLVELLMVTCITFLIILGVMTMFNFMLRTAATTTAIGSTSLDAANAIQRVETSLREARHFSLLDSTSYDATDSGGNVVAVTGIRVYFPAAYTSTSFLTSTLGATVTLSGTTALYDVSTDGNYVDFYRSDTSGNPSPNTGTCLWMKGTDLTGSVNRAVIRSVAPETTAVQFIQPYMSDGVTPIPNAVRISIVAGVNNGVAGTQTSRSSNGKQTLLKADQVYLRDHDPNGTSSVGAHGQTQVAN